MFFLSKSCWDHCVSSQQQEPQLRHIPYKAKQLRFYEHNQEQGKIRSHENHQMINYLRPFEILFLWQSHSSQFSSKTFVDDSTVLQDQKT